jgi:hypothetical protein
MKTALTLITWCVAIFATSFTALFVLGCVQMAHEWGYIK